MSLNITIVKKLRRIVSKKSLEAWRQAKSAEGFDTEMLRILFYLKVASRVAR